jgi:GT2 family glycosyltransferase
MSLVSGLLRRRYFFELTPKHELASIEGSSNTWVASGADPQFMLISRGCMYPSGWVFLNSFLLRTSENRTAKLFFDIGQGFQESHSLFVPVSRKGTISEILYLPRGIKALRWDPMESPGKFRQQPLVFIEITQIERLTRMARRVIPLWKQHPELRQALTRYLSQSRTGKLKRAYAFAGLLRNDAKSLATKISQEANPAQKTIIDYVRPNQSKLNDAGPSPLLENRYILGIDSFNNHSLAGWVIDKEVPEQPVLLDLYINGMLIERRTADLERRDVAAHGHGATHGGFLFLIPKRFQSADVLEARLCLADRATPIDGFSYVYTPRDVLIRGLLSAVESLNRIGRSSDRNRLSSLLPATKMSVLQARRVLWPMMVEHLRKDYSRENGPFANLPNVLAIPETPHPIEDKVDIIIPVYKGLEETIACITSVLAAKVTTPYELIVVNDCSPEPPLTENLKKLASTNNINLIENKKRLGFVSSVNLGMMEHEASDVVLLHSDMVVSDGWLDRLRSAAYADTNIATATPFSNRATICSFPLSNQDNDLPTGMSLSGVAEAFSRVNFGRIVDLPTAMGSCMYIRREALRETGYFDEQWRGKGNGEENDFCLRASTLGWRHVMACDTFVKHHGSGSLLAEGGARSTKKLETIHRLYPDYHHTLMRFIENDPLANYRLHVFVELVKQYSSRYVLFILHALGGGSDFAAAELSKRLISENQWVLTLTAMSDDSIKLSVFGTNLSAIYQGPSRYARLKDDLQRLNVRLIQVHQLVGYSHEIYGLIMGLGVPFDVTIHDYYYICPRVNLIDASERYCGEPDESGCRQCLNLSDTHESCQLIYRQLGSDIGAWREHHIKFLRNARCVFAPSYDTQGRMQRYHTYSNIVVRPHPEPHATIRPHRPTLSPILSVAIIGAIGVHKGFKVIIACAEDAQQRKLPIRYVVIGYTCDDSIFKNYANVTVTGKYERWQLGNLLSQHNCTIAGFFSVWPETYSYSLSEAWAFGLFPIAFNIGAPAERIEKNGYGMTIPFPCDPKVINDCLIQIGRALDQHHPKRPIGVKYSSIMADYYGFSDNLEF